MFLSVIVALSLLPVLRDDKGRGLLAIACACSFYLYTSYMVWALAILVFVLLARDDKECERFSLWPAIGAAVFIFVALMPLSSSSVSALTELLGPSVPASTVTNQFHNWLGSAQLVIAIPVLETYIICVWMYGTLAKPKVGIHSGRLVTGLFFGLMHFHPVALVFYSLAGWTLVWLYEKHGFWCALTANSLVAVLILILGGIV